jgi:hypothetical protein
VGALRTSEEDIVVAGEGTQARTQEDRAVDPGEAKIVIAPGPIAAPRPAPTPHPLPQPIAPPAKAGGLWLVILVYILASAALATALYERFLV